MADTSSQLTQLQPRTLLSFQAPVIGPIPSTPRYVPPPRHPSARRQGERLSPQFRVLQESLISDSMSLGSTPGASDPDYIIVFEVAGTVQNFRKAVQQIDGLNFIIDYLGDDLEPDEDFYSLDSRENKKPVTQTLYLVMANITAVEQLIQQYRRWQSAPDERLELGLAPLKQLFKTLHTVRRWGPKDRVFETGILDALREDIEVKGHQSPIRVEVELVWRHSHSEREAAQERVSQVLGSNAVRSVTILDQIQYHAILAEITFQDALDIHNGRYDEVDVLCIEDVLFLADAAPMGLDVEAGEDLRSVSVDSRLPIGEPKVALLDGLPLANHDFLKDRLRIDDPNSLSPNYLPRRCRHGTAMASLIIHGDLSNPGPAISTPLYVQPVMEPDEIDPTENKERLPLDRLFVDVIHAGFERMFGGAEPAAPNVQIVNISLGDTARPFIRHMSPLARLIDYLSSRYNVLIIVSAGNHGGILPDVPTGTLDSPKELATAVRHSLYEQRRYRRLLSPAESINALTIGATHDDAADSSFSSGTTLDPVEQGEIAIYSASGPGFQRSPKPEIHFSGGRSLVVYPVQSGSEHNVKLFPARTESSGPGVLVAAPTSHGGTSGTLYMSGTSNSAALTTRYANHVLNMLETLVALPGIPSPPDADYYPILTKTLLVHATLWPANRQKERGNRRYLSEFLGFGMLDPARLGSTHKTKVTLIGAGSINEKERHKFIFPLPPSLSNFAEWRRLIVTLSWFSPIVASSQIYRVARLEIKPPRSELGLERTQVDYAKNGKGTVQHQVLESKRARPFLDGDELEINVDCRVRVGNLEIPVKFGLAATLEIGDNVDIDIYSEVRDRLRTQVTVPARVG